MKLLDLPNLSAGQVKEIDAQALPLFSVRHDLFDTKAEFKEWQKSPSADHHHLSMIEGVNPHQRVGPKNVATIVRGLILDYDSVVPREEVLAAVERRSSIEFPVQWVATTYSGGCRMLLEFEKPVRILSPGHAKTFLSMMLREGGFKKLLPGLDEKAFLDTALYYELGRDWQHLGDGKISRLATEHALYKAVSMKRTFLGEVQGMNLSWDFIKSQMHKQYAGAWLGDGIYDGARGNRFWDPDGKDRSAAIMTSKGVVFFSDGGGFQSWTDIFGWDAVKEFQVDSMGAAVNDIWFDGNHYYRPEVDEGTGEHKLWVTLKTRELLVSYLRHLGLSKKGQDGQDSEIDQARILVENDKLVAAAAPFLYDPRPIVDDGGRRILNTSTVKPFMPGDLHAGPLEWGEGFPFIKNWWEVMFAHTEPQLDLFLSWLSRFYRSAVDGDLRKGHALFLAGGVDAGKTLLSTLLVSNLLGGHRDASNFLLGADMFNANIFETGLATVDDERQNSSDARRKAFSNMVKKLAANFTHELRKMYKDSVTVRWNGRVIVTLNDDPESIRMLPDVSISMADKVIILQVGNKVTFPKDIEQVLREELPAVARYLYHYEIPKICRGDSRFGVTSYIHPELEEQIRHSADDEPIAEMINEWREAYFSVKDEDPYWEGTPNSLIVELEGHFDKGSIVLKDLTAQRLGIKLKKIISSGSDWLSVRRSNRGMEYRITR